MSDWSDPHLYERESWRLGTLRGEYVRTRRLASVKRLLREGELLLDVGVGPATMSRDFACTVVGCDRSLGMLREAKKKVFDVILCDAQYLPFMDKVYDVSFESSCLYLVPDRLKALSEMVRVANRMIITFESNRWSLRRLFTKAKLSKHPSPKVLKKYHKELGLKPELRMVGFAPFSSSKFVFRIWQPIEKMIESVPMLKYLCGGILVFSHIDNRIS